MAHEHRKVAVAGLCLAVLVGSASAASAVKDVVITTSGDRLVPRRPPRTPPRRISAPSS